MQPHDALATDGTVAPGWRASEAELRAADMGVKP